MILALNASISRWAQLTAIVFAVIATIVAIATGTPRYLGSVPTWYQTTPWKESLLFASMILGICTKVLRGSDRRATSRS